MNVVSHQTKSENPDIVEFQFAKSDGIHSISEVLVRRENESFFEAVGTEMIEHVVFVQSNLL